MRPDKGSHPAFKDFMQISKNSLGFFKRYLSDTSSKRLEIDFSCVVDDENEIDAFVKTTNLKRFDMFLSGGFIKTLISIYVAILEVETGTNSGPFGDLVSRLPDYPNLRVSANSVESPDPLTRVLHVALFLTLTFVAFHEFGHVRLGHFNYLFAWHQRHGKNSLRLMISECYPSIKDKKNLLPTYFKSMELEADIIGFASLIGTSVGLFIIEMPPDDIEIFSAAGVKEEAMLISELALYAACISLSLIEVNRKRLLGSSGYPRPFTRILALFRQFIVSTKGNWREDSGGRKSIVAKIELEEFRRYGEILATALGVCHFTCEESGFTLPKKYQVASEADFLSDAFSLAHLTDDGDVALRSPEGRELHQLDLKIVRFKQRMKKFRLDQSDNVDGFA